MLGIKKDQISVSCDIYKRQSEGTIYSIELKNKDISIFLTNIGCAITAIHVPDRQTIVKNIVAGYQDLMDYQMNTHYFGCLIGRYANRISDANIKIGEHSYQLSRNDSGNHLHGGFSGFNKKLFSLTSVIHKDDEVGVVFDYLSKDGEEGYPGNLQLSVKYWLNNQNQLFMEYEAHTDQSTPVNLANHSYFNLSGFETTNILDHKLLINAHCYTESIGDIPTGNILPLKGTVFDFKSSRTIGLHAHQFLSEGGYNQNYILQEHGKGELVLAAKLQEPRSGRTLTIYTDQPGIQLYTANSWDGKICGTQDKYYQRYGAVALETQNFPDSPNHPNFPNAILNPGEKYSTTTIYEFGLA